MLTFPGYRHTSPKLLIYTNVRADAVLCEEANCISHVQYV